MSSTSPKWRLYNSYDTTVMHIMSGCPMLAASLFTNWHSKIATYIHWCILNDIGGPTEKFWFKYKPTNSINKNNHTIMWDLPITKDTWVPHNQLDIIIHKWNKTTFLIIVIAVLQDNNVVKKQLKKSEITNNLKLKSKDVGIYNKSKLSL